MSQSNGYNIISFTFIIIFWMALFFAILQFKDMCVAVEKAANVYVETKTPRKIEGGE